MERNSVDQLLIRARLAVLLTAFALTFFSGTAAASIRFAEIGRWGGMCSAVSISGNRAYIGMDSSVLITDVSDPTSPDKLGTVNLPTPGRVASIDISGNYAYVLAYGSGLYTVNVSDPGNPTVAGFCGLSSYARDVEVSGDYAYVADWNTGLKVVNVSDPANPTQVGSYAISGSCYGIAVSGDYAYLTDSSGLLAIDISNPAQPTGAGVVAGVYARDIAISGNRMYTASGFTNGFQIFDISSPASPVRMGIYDTPGQALGVAVSGDYAYVGDSLSGLQVINVSNPASPSLVSTLDTVDSAGLVALCGNLALVADRWDGLLAIDVSDPASPIEAWACRSGNVGGIAVSGSTVYAACSEDDGRIVYALNALDASDPSSITQIGSCPIPSSGPADLSRGYVWVSGYSKGLHIIDVTPPANPITTGTYDTPGTAKDVALFAHYACVADGDSGIQVIDVTHPVSPVRVGGYNTNGFAYAVAISGNRAYVADGNKGLQVISLANPAVPTLVGSYPIQTDAYDIEISGNSAYMATGNGGLQIFDITNPATPVWIGGSSCVSSYSLTLSGSYVYIDDAVFDVSDPTNPVIVGRNASGGDAVVSGGRVYARSNGILKVMQMTQSDQCIVYGYVKDPLGNPMNGITISTTPGSYTATTDWKGRYELDYIDPGEHTITASGLGWAPASTTIALADGQTIQATDIVLLFGTLTGRVNDDLGNPIADAGINIGGLQSATTDTDGNYSANSLTPGSYYLTASKVGYVSSSQLVSVLGSQTTTCDFTLVRTGSITGFVRDNLGRPIYRISVAAYPYCTGTDSNGAYMLSDVPPGTHNVTASDSSWTSVTENNVVVTAGGTVTVDFVLQLGTISGTVRDRAGNPVPDAAVSCSTASLYATTDSNGAFTFVNVGPTYGSSDRGPVSYKLTAAKTGYTSSSTNVHVKGGQTTTCDFILTAYGSISGTVTDSAGRPIGGASIRAIYSCHIYTATTDSAGHYIISDMLPASGISLVATRNGCATVMKKLTVSDGLETVCNFRLADAIVLDLVSSTSITTSVSSLHGIAVSSGIAAVGSGTGLQFVDVSNPVTPVKLSTFGSSSDVVLSGNYAYVAAGSDGLQILNVSNPSAPSLVGSCDTSGTARAVDVVGNYAYVADDLSGLQIIDISNPANPLRVGGYDTSGNARGLDVAGGYAYVADVGGGLQIIDVHNPANPVLLGHYSVPNCRFADVAVSGNHAYVSDGYLGLFQVIDISVPANPTLIGTGYVTANSQPGRICMSGNYAYVGAGYYGGVMVYDISSPTDPGLAVQYANYRGKDIAVSDGYVYVADYDGNLVIFTPSYLKVTGIAPQRAANSDTALTASLTGLGFKEGDMVRLTRAGQADINATEVSVVDAGLISCRLNLGGAVPGFWNVVVIATDGLSSCLQGGFVIILPDSAPCVAIVNRSVEDAIMTAACSRWRFRLFGNVTQTTSDSFWISDGSGVSVEVYAPDYSHTRINTGKYVAVTGTLDLSSDTAVLMSTDAQIDRLD